MNKEAYEFGLVDELEKMAAPAFGGTGMLRSFGQQAGGAGGAQSFGQKAMGAARSIGGNFADVAGGGVQVGRQIGNAVGQAGGMWGRGVQAMAGRSPAAPAAAANMARGATPPAARQASSGVGGGARVVGLPNYAGGAGMAAGPQGGGNGFNMTAGAGRASASQQRAAPQRMARAQAGGQQRPDWSKMSPQQFASKLPAAAPAQATPVGMGSSGRGMAGVSTAGAAPVAGNRQGPSKGVAMGNQNIYGGNQSGGNQRGGSMPPPAPTGFAGGAGRGAQQPSRGLAAFGGRSTGNAAPAIPKANYAGGGPGSAPAIG